MRNISSILCLVLATITVFGQPDPFVSHPDQLTDNSFAHWIGPGSDSDEGVFYFRKKVFLEKVPDQCLVHVSADNRYRLHVNGNLLSWGPAVNDLYHWNYETVDIAPFLVEGENILASQVWNPGRLKGSRQVSFRTAFILQGPSLNQESVNTNSSWVVKKDDGYHFMEMNSDVVGGGYIAGATDSLTCALHPWEWNQQYFDDSGWKQAAEFGKGNHSGLDTWLGTPWLLTERRIPPVQQKKERIPTLLHVAGMEYKISDYEGRLHLEVAPHSQVEVLMDNRELTMGFPELYFSGGKGSKLKIQYQESMFDPDGGKGNRNQWRGKEMKGYYDVVYPDGNTRMFEPLWIRVFRFVKLTIETGSEPLSIYDFYNKYTSYPFEQKASFESSMTSLDLIWNASWRTVRLCALETYMDCPYYEQIQYIGDTRIQALISLYVTGDDRLVRNALVQFYNSMQPMGLTQSRYPAEGRQIIPPFSLYFIAMVHDYHMHRDDPQFVSQFLPGMRFILDWFVHRMDNNGMLGPLPFWNHIDGGTKFRAGSPPGIDTGGSAHMSILLAYAMDRAVELFNYFGDVSNADRYNQISETLKASTLKQCYSKETGLIAETPSKEIYSQHTNTFAILTHMFEEEKARFVAGKMISDESLIQATLYFRFYLFRALKETGIGGEIIPMMDRWQEFLDLGLTTFPEHGINSRSDCHAWSAHPIYDFLHITCGIAPGSPGFKTVTIQPQPGNLKNFRGSIPHPNGTISVDFRKSRSGATIEIILPDKLNGRLLWSGQELDLRPGKQVIHL